MLLKTAVLATLFASSLALAHEASGDLARRHHNLAARAANPEPEPGAHSLKFHVSPVHNDLEHKVSKRDQFSGKATWYNAGQGACNGYNHSTDMIVALNTPQYGSYWYSSHCLKWIAITANGRTVNAQIVDECPGCGFGGLDMSQSLFERFFPLGTGTFGMTWHFTGYVPAPPAPPPPVSTHHSSSSTHHSTATITHHSTSTSTHHSTSTSTSTHHSSSSTHSTTTTSTSASSTTTGGADPTESASNFLALNRALMQYVVLLGAAVDGAHAASS